MTETKDNSANNSDKNSKQTIQDQSYAVEKVVNFRNVALFTTFLSITFQSGRLYIISPLLPSYITIGDALLKIGIAMPVVGTFLIFLVNVVEDSSDRLRKNEPFKGSLAYNIMNGLSYFGLFALVILIGVSLYEALQSEITFSNLTAYIGSIAKAIAFIVIVRIFAHVIWQVSIVRRNAEISGDITDRDLMSLFVYGVSLSLVAGLLSSFFSNYDDCQIKTSSGIQNAKFLSALQKVTALEIGGQTVIMSNSQIEYINCEIPRPSTDVEAAP